MSDGRWQDGGAARDADGHCGSVEDGTDKPHTWEARLREKSLKINHVSFLDSVRHFGMIRINALVK